MKKIAHRGNLSGPNTGTENSLESIRACIDKGYDVEVDLWVKGNDLYTGHDKPQYNIPRSFLTENRCYLWLHCKHHPAMEYMTKQREMGLNYFWHQSDDVTLTSLGYIWTYPGKSLGYKSIAVCPDRVPEWEIPNNISGVCSDYIDNIDYEHLIRY